MKLKRKQIYVKAAVMALLITLLLHFFSLLLFAGFDFFGPGSTVPLGEVIARHKSVAYSSVSIFLFLTAEFMVVFSLQEGRKRYRFWLIVLVALIVALVFSLISLFIYNLSSEAEMIPMRMFGTLLASVFLSFVVILISYIDHLTRRQEIIALENESLKTQNIKSRYDALKNQIDPHFLFNTFSSLTSMIELDPARAQEFSIKMSSVFRYTLQNKDYVTLAEELEFSRDYCALMQIRYGENLTICFDIDESYSSHMVVPLCVQTLIENAVKHNEISNRAGLKISVHTNNNGTLTVSNGINAKRDDAKGTGTGLANLSERYMLKWQREVQIYSNEKIFMVTIPLIEPQNEQEHENSNHRRRATACETA